MRSRSLDIALFVALLATALALGPALAHLLELPNKIALPRDDYFIVQQIYRGWSLLGWLLLVEFLSMVAVIVLARHCRRVLWPTMIALLCLLAAQALFWTFTYPANIATAFWTQPPDNWQTLRRHWEYSHAAGAALQFVALIALVIAALARPRSTS